MINEWIELQMGRATIAGSRVAFRTPPRSPLANVNSGGAPVQGMSGESPTSRLAQLKLVEEMSVEDIALCTDPSLVSLLVKRMPTRRRRLPVFEKICPSSDVGMLGWQVSQFFFVFLPRGLLNGREGDTSFFGWYLGIYGLSLISWWMNPHWFWWREQVTNPALPIQSASSYSAELRLESETLSFLELCLLNFLALL